MIVPELAGRRVVLRPRAEDDAPWYVATRAWRPRRWSSFPGWARRRRPGGTPTPGCIVMASGGWQPGTPHPLARLRPTLPHRLTADTESLADASPCDAALAQDVHHL